MNVGLLVEELSVRTPQGDLSVGGQDSLQLGDVGVDQGVEVSDQS